MSGEKFVLSMDQGTTSSRTIIFNAAGEIVSMAQQEFTQIFPQPGWVEHDPNEIWETQLKTAREAIKKAGITTSEIAGIGITNQRETTVMWDRKSGVPIHNAIVWQDRRTSAFCDELKAAGKAPEIQERSGLVIDAYFSGSKVRWFLDHVSDARRRAEAGELAFGTIDSWLLWNLTGGQVHATDVTNASRTMLFNLDTLEWDQTLLDLVGVPREVLPQIHSSSEVYGESNASLFGESIPIAGIGGDQHAALFGQACHEKGLAKNTYGTGCFAVMNTGHTRVKSESNLLTTMAWQLGQGGEAEYALEGSIFVAGAVVQWLRDQLGIIKKASDIEEMACSVEDNGGVFFVPAFAGLGAPHWDQYARGTITGLTRGASKGHLARAALEGIAFQVRDVLIAMSNDSGIQLSELRVDGGASMNSLLMQFQADILGVPVVRPKITETTALGAAYLAGLATGIWKNQSEIASQWAIDATFEPSMDQSSIDQLIEGWERAVEQTKCPA